MVIFRKALPRLHHCCSILAVSALLLRAAFLPSAGASRILVSTLVNDLRDLEESPNNSTIVEESLNNTEDVDEGNLPQLMQTSMKDVSESDFSQSGTPRRLSEKASLIQDAVYLKAMSLELKQGGGVTMGVTAGVTMILLCACWGAYEASKGTNPHGRLQHLYKGRVIYEWDQTSEMINIYIKPPPGLKKRDFEITVQPNNLKVGRKGKAAFLKEKIFDKVDAQKSSWDLRNDEIQIYLQKECPGDWPAALQHRSSESNAGLSSTAMNFFSKRLSQPYQNSDSANSERGM